MKREELPYIRLKYRAHVEMGQSPPSGEYSLAAGQGLPFLQGTADFSDLYPEPRTFCPTPTKVALPNDILFSVRAPVGELNWANQEYGIGRGLCAIRVGERLDRSFAWWALHWVRHELNAVATGSTYEAVAIEDVANLPVPCPSVAEQRAIADYLDRETARLDALVSAKQRQLALLAEKRRSLITRAVTRGLDPNAPRRESGLAWLGEVPGHWLLTRLKYLGAIYYGIGQPPEYQDQGVPFLRATNVERGRINPVGLVFVDPDDLPEARIINLRVGDIIVVRSGAYTGDSALITAEWHGAIAGFDMIIRPSTSALPAFLSQTLLIQYVLEAQINPLSVRAAQPHLNAEELGSVIIALPPFEEQRAIVAHIEAQTQKIDALRAATERTLALLKERRAALIAEAVTGRPAP